MGTATGWCPWYKPPLTPSFTPGCPPVSTPLQPWVCEPGLLSPPCGTSWDGKQALEAARGWLGSAQLPPACPCPCRNEVTKMKFEGKTFYLYVSQKEVSASPSPGASWAQWASFRGFSGNVAAASPWPAGQGHGDSSVPLLGSPPCSCWCQIWVLDPRPPLAPGQATAPPSGLFPRCFLIATIPQSQPEHLWLQLAPTGSSSRDF